MVLEEYDNQHDDIPDPLKRLSKLILRAFYAYDHCLSKSNFLLNRKVRLENVK